MGWKDNFRQAVRELLLNEEQQGTVLPETDGASTGQEPVQRVPDDPEGASAAQAEGLGGTSGPLQEDAIPLAASLAPPRRKTVIAEDSVVRGDIEAAGGVELYGDMRGDLSSEEDVLVSGKLIGGSTSRNLEMTSGRMRGDVTASTSVHIDEESVLLGGVKARELFVGGRVRGDLDIQDTVTLAERAVVLGDVSAQRLSVSPGAALQGKLRISSSDIDAAFVDDML